jgi:hypothetical protein
VEPARRGDRRCRRSSPGLGGSLVGDRFQPAAHRTPLFTPGIGLVLAGEKPPADLVDLAEGDDA